MTGEVCGFLIIFGDDGAVRHIYFSEVENGAPPNHDSLRETQTDWLFYYPFDAPEWIWVGWQNVRQETFERLIGEPFEDALLSPLSPAETDPNLTEFPVSWGRKF